MGLFIKNVEILLNRRDIVEKINIVRVVLIIASTFFGLMYISGARLEGLQWLYMSPVVILIITYILLNFLSKKGMMTLKTSITFTLLPLIIFVLFFSVTSFFYNLIINKYNNIFEKSISMFCNANPNMQYENQSIKKHSKIVILNNEGVDKIYLEISNDIKASSVQDTDYIVKLNWYEKSYGSYGSGAKSYIGVCDVYVYNSNDNTKFIYFFEVTGEVPPSTKSGYSDWHGAYPKWDVVDNLNSIFS